MKTYYPMPYLPDSGNNDQDFSFMTEEGKGQLTTNIKGSFTDSLRSFDSLRLKGPDPIIIYPTGQTSFL
jgi:hypothetical protein